MQTCAVLVMYYGTLLLLCMLRITRKYNITLALKLILLICFGYIGFDYSANELLH